MHKYKISPGILFSISLLTLSFTLYRFVEKSNPPFLVFSKGNSFVNEWTKVDSLEKMGLTRSALDAVEIIYKKAKAENNHAQVVKAVIYKLKFDSYLEEENYVKAIAELKNETEKSTFPLRNVMHSILAETYWRYYQQNRWRFLNRTETSAFIADDIRTWDLKKIVQSTINHHSFSLNNADSLKRTSVSLFDDILMNETSDQKPQTTNESHLLRPTLYDFLAHRTVDFFMNEESGLTQPSYKFELSSPDYFLPAGEFAKMLFVSRDTLSLKYNAALILKDIVAFHLNDPDPSALVDADLKRLKFARNHSVLEAKDSLYFAALVALHKKHSSHPVSAELAYEMALYLFEQSGKYDPLKSDEFKWKKSEALKLCEAAIQAHPNSYGAENCKNLVSRIKEKSLSLIVEKAELPDKTFKALVRYRNIDRLWLRLVRYDYNEFREFNNQKDIHHYTTLNPLLQWSIELPKDDEGDYNEHSVEIKLPPQQTGFYLLLASTGEKFITTENAVSLNSFWITNISCLTRQEGTGGFDVTVLHRETGTPLSGVKAELFTKKYEYSTRSYDYRKIDTQITDENGQFTVPPSSQYLNFTIIFKYKDESYTTDNNYFTYYSKGDPQKQLHTFFFTDRSIYRPGQMLHFKGIIIETDPDKDKKLDEKNELRSDFNTTVALFDANYQKVAEQNLVSNEYGTISGTFILPQNGLTGQMHIETPHGQHYFSVEEYKRPRFEVNFDTLKGSYRLGEIVTVKGAARAYAGSNIDGAKVQYRIVRNAVFHHWWWRGPMPNVPQMEVGSGATATDEKGEFSVTFSAAPDKSIAQKFSPTFSFTVTADVTDLNGETRSGSQSVAIGYTSMLININLPEQRSKSDTNQLLLRTTNLAGKDVPAQGTVTVYRLREPDRLLRNRLWQQPDKHILSKQEYYADFPKDVYSDEDDKEKWEKVKMIEKPFNNRLSSSKLEMNFREWEQGQYILEAVSRDSFGEAISYKKHFTLFSADEKSAPVNEFAWFTVLNDKCEPQEKAAFLIGTKEKNVKVLFDIEIRGKSIEKKWLLLNDEQRKIEILAEENYRGNFAVHFVFVKDNRSYSFDRVVTVPYTNKELDIEFETFRNKLLPGQQEEWKIKIKNKKGEKIAAELLASMYDASLDALRPHGWTFSIYQSYYSTLNWQHQRAFTIDNSRLYHDKWNIFPELKYHDYERLNWFGFEHYYSGYNRHSNSKSGRDMNDETIPQAMAKSALPAEVMAGVESGYAFIDALKVNGTTAVAGLPVPQKTGEQQTLSSSASQKMAAINVRTNFNETAFFYPQLQTNDKGEVIISFTVPESLTRWKFMSFAHTKDLMYGLTTKEVSTQKDLMVMPNAPRFFRENDRMVLSAKVTNFSDKELSGTAEAFFFDAVTMKDLNIFTVDAVNNIKGEATSVNSFSVKKGQSTAVKWNIQIPSGVQAITYKIVAKSGTFSDGEEAPLPVLTNRMLVTESMPLPVRGDKQKTFRFEKLLNSGQSPTLKNHKLTLEFTSNPAWYAIQALPYMMEYPYDCSEQIFSRLYANSIAEHIAKSSPKIKTVFDSWKTQSPDALLSNLEKNQELKSLLLEETPWVMDAKDETERKKRIALLFDINKMGKEKEQSIRKLEKTQVLNGGGWPWFPGMTQSRYITQHIVAGFGHLDKIGIEGIRKDHRYMNMIRKAVQYLDDRIREDYEWLLRHKADLSKNNLNSTQVHYLYARSYFKDIPVDKRNETPFNYFLTQSQKHWLGNNRYLQGMIALALHRYNDKIIPVDIIKSLRENAIFNEELGMYWKDMTEGYYWHQAPIETQALLIEAFDEVAADTKAIEDMKVWLLKNKQTNDWKTTKATAEACYALLLRGVAWLSDDRLAEISLGSTKVDPNTIADVKAEAGTGYFKTSWSGADIKPDMGAVTVTPPPSAESAPKVRWGALYWQYFEQLDKITPHETPLKLNKKLFLEKPSETGPVITPITETTLLQPGDKIKVRIELRVDREMEYVHMKDMRAAGLEPVNVLSQYKWQDGLGYYESTRDAATNFFFEHLSKGTFVFEYPLRVTHSGDFSNGITTIQCMYAPEFVSHSQGVRVKVGE